MNETAKKIGIGALIVILICSIASIALYAFTLNHVKYVDVTVEVGAFPNSSDKQYVIEVKYNSNKNKNGIELLDIRLNGYLDAKQIDVDNPRFYSKGVQFVGSDYGSINFNLANRYDNSEVDAWAELFGTPTYFYRYYDSSVLPKYYDTSDGVSFSAIDKIDENSVFKIAIGNEEDSELYLMRLTGKSKTDVDTRQVLWITQHFGWRYDMNYLAMSILQVCQKNSNGQDAFGTQVVDMGDFFQFKEYDSKKTDWITSKETSNLDIDVTQYFNIHFDISSDGAQQSSDSLFGMVDGKSDFAYITDDFVNDYFVGNQVVTFTEKNFRLNDGLLSLNESSKLFLKQHEKINFNVIVDLNELQKQGVMYNGFSNDFISSYKNRIISIKLKQTDANGNITFTEVTL